MEEVSMEAKEARLNQVDGVTVSKRLEESLGMIVILFAEVESVRLRLEEKEK